MEREIIVIDGGKCNGCGLCVPTCHEGALQIIDSKAVLVSELMCDGLGACIGHCPEGALTIEKREAESYDEIKVMTEMAGKGKNVVIAHLKHLKDHDEQTFLKQGIRFLWDNKNNLNFNPAEVVEEVYGLTPVSKPFQASSVVAEKETGAFHACPGSRSLHFESKNKVQEDAVHQQSELTQWPVQLHLINPAAGYFTGADLLIAADCVAYSVGNFHNTYLKNKKLVIACPKLDSGLENYVQKIKRLIEEARLNTITVMRMEVPCCGGLLQIVKEASENTLTKVPVKEMIVSVSGDIIRDSWI